MAGHRTLDAATLVRPQLRELTGQPVPQKLHRRRRRPVLLLKQPLGIPGHHELVQHPDDSFPDHPGHRPTRKQRDRIKRFPVIIRQPERECRHSVKRNPMPL